MKNKIFKKALFTCVFSLAAVANVNAATINYDEQSSNKDDYKINLIIKDKGDILADSYVEVKGLSFTAENNLNYTVKFLEKDETPLESVRKYSNEYDEYFGKDRKNYVELSLKESGAISGDVDDEIYLLNKDLYAVIYNCTGVEEGGVSKSYCKPIFNEPIKVGKPDGFPELGKRYKVSFFGADGSEGFEKPQIFAFALFPNYFSSDLEFKRTIHIGLINDNEVLKSLANKEAGALNKLMNYAKTTTKMASYDQNLISGSAHFYVEQNLDIIDGNYYFVYTEVDNESGKYVDLNDVIVVKGEKGWFTTEFEYNDYENDPTVIAGDVTTTEYEYACYQCSNDYVWYQKGYQPSTCSLLAEIDTKAKCVKQVKTGVKDYLPQGVLILTLGSAVVYLLNKKSKFSRI